MRTKSRVKLALNSPPLSSTREHIEICLFDAITFVVPAKEQHVDYYQIVKEQPIVRILEPEIAWRRLRDKQLSVLNSRVRARCWVSAPSPASR